MKIRVFVWDGEDEHQGEYEARVNKFLEDKCSVSVQPLNHGSSGLSLLVTYEEAKAVAAVEARTMLQAGEAIMRDIQQGAFTVRKECVAISGASAKVAHAALERLVKAKLLSHNSGAYSKTAAGCAASSAVIAMALTSCPAFSDR